MNRVGLQLLSLMALMGPGAAFSSPFPVRPNPDTVIGIASRNYGIDSMAWTPERFVRIRNTGNAPIQVQPPAHDTVYNYVDGKGVGYGAHGWVYTIRRHGGTFPLLQVQAWGGQAVALAAGDSLDYGLFQIGPIAITKRSAAVTPLEAFVGDTVRMPVTIRYGSDSLKFILKTRIVETVFGVGIRKEGGTRPAESQAGKSPSVTADGRWVIGPVPAKRMSFRAPGTGTAYRPR
jgi:hypothetical protein